MKAIHQLVAGFSYGDAISNEARRFRSLFRSWGFASDIYAESRRILPALRKEAKDLDQLARDAGPEDVVLLHLSIGSPANDVFRHVQCRKALLYHNITPADFFTGIQDQIAADLARGRRQAASLAGVAEVVMACSQYNADELIRWGYRDPKTLPLVIDWSMLETPPNRRVVRQLTDDWKHILFVGRGVPNKRIEDLLYAFYYYRRYVNDRVRLIHVGSYAGMEQYQGLLLTKIRELGLRGYVDLVGSVRQDELTAYYRCADLFLSMSEHEGFCIPVLESMFFDVPVMAGAEAAVPETMDGAGILFSGRDYALLAEMMHRAMTDAALRDAVIRAQRQRLQRYRGRDLEKVLHDYLGRLLV